MAEWTTELVADRLVEAVRTARRLPPAKAQGYFNCWPAIQREPWETFGAEPDPIRFPPEPAAIERMLVSMRWMQWLAVDQRLLVWMRAKHYPWHSIARRCGCDRTTAWRRWQRAILIITTELNGPGRANLPVAARR